MSAVPDTEITSVTVRAPAKINLFLGVGRVRPDGFHPLDTIYQAVSLYDDVTVTDAREWSVRVLGDAHVDLSSVPHDESNIAVRAGRALAAHHGVDLAASIEIHKGIPVAGGMAGGSADAAATLVALDRLWGLGTADEELLAIAAALGSDVPFALIGGTARGTGRGEVVTPVPDRGTWWWVVVLDSEGLSTPSVYAAFDLLHEKDLSYEVHHAILDTLRVDEGPLMLAEWLRNDLEPPAFHLRPDLDETAQAVVDCGALAAHLSGSGPTVLGLARDAGDARTIAGRLAERGYDHVLVAHGPVAGAHVVSYG